MSTLAVETSAGRRARAACSCSHCGLPVPAGLFEEGAAEQFCCAGCRTVWGVLHAGGLEQYYRVRAAVEAPSERARTTGARYEELDDPAFRTASVRELEDGSAETDLLLEGVHCAACVWLVERLGRVTPGVIESRVHVRTRIARVRFDPERVALSRIARALDSLGYPVHPARGQAARDARTREDRRHLIRVAVAGALAGNIMLLAVALYGGEIAGIDPLWDGVFRWVSMGLGVVSLAWPGRVFFRGALAALRTRTAHLDLPIAIALLAGGAWGVTNTVRGTGEIYFDSLAVLVFLLLVGRWVQHRQQRAAADEVGLMLTLTPTSAVLVAEDGSTRRAPIESVAVGSLVEVGPGEVVPADGVVEVGHGAVDESLLTGESAPVSVRAGSPVAAGSVNMTTVLRVRVAAVGEGTRVARLMRLVAEASERKSPIVQLTDRIAGRFVLVVLTLALVTTVIWTVRADAHTALEHATALLIITCPCALGLATPMAMSVALGRAARMRTLVKSAAALEALARPGAMVLDKTGTVTEGRMSAAWFEGDDRLRGIAAALEERSAHPIGRAIVAEAPSRPAAVACEHLSGRGVRGRVDGGLAAVGSPEFVADESGVAVDADAVRRALDAGLTPVAVWAEGIGSGVFAIGDRVRDDAAEAVSALRAMGWSVRMASGDDPAVVGKVAAAVGVTDAEGRVSPEGKADLVTRLCAASDRPVVMVGDGVNDAAALAAATVGIAVHGGAEASLEAADIYISEPGVRPLVELVRLARSTKRTIRICLGASLTYNAIGATLAMCGLMSALLAAVIMPISSLVVVSIAVRPLKKRGGVR
ncbi:MAG: cadmium-translocating P-type ATPase [Phycisphaerales bacterium]|nr:cadmium-translocating P-type ATPase [Planctomycetota bacterium]MCH8508471.1 cadmium-translocating P-type ATPase [Phycisphaerales bacterium]